MIRRTAPVALAILTSVFFGLEGARGQATKETSEYIRKWVNQPDGWFKSEEGQRIVTNIISWQNSDTAGGGWHKSYNTLIPRPGKVPPTDNGPLAPASDSGSVWDTVSTIDNDATYSEMKVLARAVRVTGREDAKASFEKGMNFLLKMQYPNGGFPQRFPLQNNYGRHITFNDGASVGVMEVLRDVAEGKGDYGWVSEGERAKAKGALEKAIDCVLKCQVVKDGKLTVWGQQHDEVTLAPTSARAYELPSLVSSESATIVGFLMSIEKPDERVKKSVEAAVAWFEAHKIEGFKYERVKGANVEKGSDRMLVADASAGPVWARFYDLETEKPMFSDRDGKKHVTLAEVSYERRNGYAWYGNYPAPVLAKYQAWKERVGK